MNRIHRWYCQSDGWKRKVENEILPWALNGVDLGSEILELGPGPGLTTDWLHLRYPAITCLEVEPTLAHSLSQRIASPNVKVQVGDATAMPFPKARFSAVLAFTMLHHVPSAGLQNRLFAEAYRVLRPGGVFLGVDSLWSLRMLVFHLNDTLVTVDPSQLRARLEAANFKHVDIETRGARFRFCARRTAELASQSSPRLD
jgi:SAM-dependent methyltransferase